LASQAGKEVKDVYGDYATLTVPLQELRSTLNIFMVYMGVLAVIAAIFAGSGLATMYDPATTLTVALIGNAMLAIFGALIAYMGGATRANTYMLLRYPLGRVGAMIGSLVVSALPLIMWFAVETWLFGITVNVIYPGHPLTSIAAASVWGGVLMMLTAYLGYRAIAILSYITVPFWYALIAIGFFGAVGRRWRLRRPMGSEASGHSASGRGHNVRVRPLRLGMRHNLRRLEVWSQEVVR
jgi:cytosine permease